MIWRLIKKGSCQYWLKFGWHVRLLKAFKKLVGVSKDGLNIDWMQQEKFDKVEMLIDTEQHTPTKCAGTIEVFEMKTPESMQTKFSWILQI